MVILVATGMLAILAVAPFVRETALQAAGAAGVFLVVSLPAAVAASKASRVRWPLTILSLLFVPVVGFLVARTVAALLDDGASLSDRLGVAPDIVEILSLLVGLILLVAGIMKLDISGFQKSVLSVLEVVLLIASVVFLGWIGLLITGIVGLLAVVVWSLHLAFRKQDILAYAATQAGVERGEMEALQGELRTWKEFKVLGPIKTANLISALSQRARSVDDIRAMAPPIALLYVVHRSDLDGLVSRFNQLMRLYGMTRDKAMHLADMLTAATRRSPATFDDTLDGLLAAAAD